MKVKNLDQLFFGSMPTTSNTLLQNWLGMHD